jgi:starch synthase
MESAMDRAIGLWYQYPEEFGKLVSQGMSYDYSWNHPGKDYLEIYDHIRHK